MNPLGHSMGSISPELISPGAKEKYLGGESRVKERGSNPEHVRENVSNIIGGSAGFVQKSANMMESLKGSIGPNIEQLDEHCEKRSQEIGLLKRHGGWAGLKNPKILADPAVREMTGEKEPSLDRLRQHMDTFRQETVSLVTQTCLGAVRAMGFDPPGSFSATGTPGWNSDIDTVYFAPTDMPEEMQVAVKALFDMIFQDKLGASSGTLLDTESYLNHAGAALDTEKMMVTTEGQRGFARVELNASSLQMLRQCGGAGKKWDDFKKAQLQGAVPEEYKRALTEAFRDVEQLEKDVQSGAGKQAVKEQMLEEMVKNGEIGSTPEDLQAAEQAISKQVDAMPQKEIETRAKKIAQTNPEGMKTAMMSYKAKGLLEVSKMMDKSKATISGLQKKMGELEKQRSYFPRQAQGAWQQAYQKVEEEQLKLANLFLLRTSFFDEGYNTQGAFIQVCFKEGGQIHQRQFENYQKQLVGKTVPQLLAQDKRFELGAAQKLKSTPLQDSTSAAENYAMYVGHHAHKVHGSSQLADHQAATVATSKYSERTLLSNKKMLEELVIKNPSLKKDKGVVDAMKQNNKLLAVASELERVKRGTVLNKSTTRTALTEALDPRVKGKAGAKKLEEVVTLLLDATEPEGSIGKLKLEESLKPQEKYLALVATLANLGLVEILDEEDSHGFLQTSDPAVDAILKARLGVPDYLLSDGSKAPVKKLHATAQQIVMHATNLNSVRDISKFNSGIGKITSEVNRLATQHRLIPVPRTGSSPAMSLRFQWQQANRGTKSL